MVAVVLLMFGAEVGVLIIPGVELSFLNNVPRRHRTGAISEGAYSQT